MNTTRPDASNFAPARAVTETGQTGPTLTTVHPIVHKVRRSYRIHRRGAAAVEFAMVAPLFILLVFGMIEYGRMVMVQQLLTNGSREGARKAVLDGATTAEVQSVVSTYLQNASISGATDRKSVV